MLQWLLEVNAKRLCDTHLLLLRLEIVLTLVKVSLQQTRDILNISYIWDPTQKILMKILIQG